MINIETYRNIYGGFLNWGVPQNGWFLRENPIKIDDDWGYPHFRKPPYRNIYRCIVTQLAMFDTSPISSSPRSPKHRLGRTGSEWGVRSSDAGGHHLCFFGNFAGQTGSRRHVALAAGKIPRWLKRENKGTTKAVAYLEDGVFYPCFTAMHGRNFEKTECFRLEDLAM